METQWYDNLGSGLGLPAAATETRLFAMADCRAIMAACTAGPTRALAHWRQAHPVLKAEVEEMRKRLSPLLGFPFGYDFHHYSDD